jgi:hypothetical protein
MNAKKIISAIFLILVNTSHAEPQIPVKLWEVYEISLQSSKLPANPYSNLILQGKPAFLSATFKGTDGSSSGKTLTVPGFWDGNNTWKIRFAPPLSGT